MSLFVTCTVMTPLALSLRVKGIAGVVPSRSAPVAR